MFKSIPLPPSVVSPAEMLFQPNVDAYEQITASHLSQFQFSGSRSAISPRDGNHRPTISPHDFLQWKFHRQIEVWRDKLSAAFDDLPPVRFERVGHVAQPDMKDHWQTAVEQTVDTNSRQ